MGVSGPNAGDFAVTGGTCGATLAGGGASCTYILKFTPSIVGAESATTWSQRGWRRGEPAQCEPDRHRHVKLRRVATHHATPRADLTAQGCC